MPENNNQNNQNPEATPAVQNQVVQAQPAVTNQPPAEQNQPSQFSDSEEAKNYKKKIKSKATIKLVVSLIILVLVGLFSYRVYVNLTSPAVGEIELNENQIPLPPEEEE